MSINENFLNKSFMEKKFQWHGKPPNKEEAKKALEELRTLGGKIISEHQ